MEIAASVWKSREKDNVRETIVLIAPVRTDGGFDFTR